MPRTFTLLRTLGRGAHGSVHLAELRDDEDFVQQLAIKRLLPECSGDRELEARLRDEARLLAMLRHDHLVHVHGLTRIEGGLAILMEPVHGVDLARLAHQGPVPPRAATEIISAVADALDAAWTTVPPGQAAPLRVVHRDIKPSNVMVTPRGGVKVMDFGVARATFEAREVQTRSQQLGTARYMAPERWLHGEAEHVSDVFSLGITWLELLTGVAAPRPRLSPGSFADDLDALLDGVAHPELRASIGAMCAFDPERRPTAADVAEGARELASTLPGPGLRAWAREAVVPSEAEPCDPTGGATVVAEDPSGGGAFGRSARLRWASATAAALVLGVAWAVSPSGRAPSGLEVPPAVVAERISVPAPVDPPAPNEQTPVGPVPPRAEVAPPVRSPTKARTIRGAASAPEAAPADVERVSMRFLLAEGLVAETDWGSITRYPEVLRLPANRVVQVRVREGADTWSCTVAVGDAPDDVHIGPRAEGGCRH